jgi:hypothetical protein
MPSAIDVWEKKSYEIIHYCQSSCVKGGRVYFLRADAQEHEPTIRQMGARCGNVWKCHSFTCIATPSFPFWTEPCAWMS